MRKKSFNAILGTFIQGEHPAENSNNKERWFNCWMDGFQGCFFKKGLWYDDIFNFIAEGFQGNFQHKITMQE